MRVYKGTKLVATLNANMQIVNAEPSFASWYKDFKFLMNVPDVQDHGCKKLVRPSAAVKGLVMTQLEIEGYSVK